MDVILDFAQTSTCRELVFLEIAFCWARFFYLCAYHLIFRIACFYLLYSAYRNLIGDVLGVITVPLEGYSEIGAFGECLLGCKEIMAGFLQASTDLN